MPSCIMLGQHVLFPGQQVTINVCETKAQFALAANVLLLHASTSIKTKTQGQVCEQLRFLNYCEE